MTANLPPKQPEPLTAEQVESALHQALAEHQAGRLQEAEKIYRAILQAQPNHPKANHNLGVLAVQTTQPLAALPYFMTALEANPTHGQYWLSYIDALVQAEQFEPAREVLALAQQQGLQGEEVDALAMRLEGETPTAQPNTEVQHPLTGTLPISPSPKKNSKKKPKAKPAGKSARHKEKHPSIEDVNTLIALFNEGRYTETVALAQTMTRHFPLYGLGWKVLGAVFRQMGRSADALVPMQKATALLPNDDEVHSNLGVTLHDLGHLEEAEACYRRALELKPNFAQAHSNLGNILMERSHLDEAATSYRRALELNPGAIKVRFDLTQAKKGKVDDENLAALIAIEDAARNGAIPLSDENAVFLNFALGNSYNDMGDYDKAFPHFLKGCRLKHAAFNYDSNQIARRLFASTMRAFDQSTLDRLRGGGNPSHLPIFVLGMPRSGTTLIEQIISSHPEVYGAGELTDLMMIAQRDVAGTTFPDNLPFLDQTQLTAWGTEYVAGLQQRAPNARHITDKMPTNFFAVGLIHLMLPNARIIHVNRNPVDTCLSCLTTLFENKHEHTYDLEELGRYYVDYARLMEHWRKLLPSGAFLDVQYEDIVADQEAQSRRIIEYCGLEWDDACIDFHKNNRPISTASMSQVRQPIYKSSVERWRSYEKFLGPLFDALGELAPDH